MRLIIRQFGAEVVCMLDRVRTLERTSAIAHGLSWWLKE